MTLAVGTQVTYDNFTDLTPGTLLSDGTNRYVSLDNGHTYRTSRSYGDWCQPNRFVGECHMVVREVGADEPPLVNLAAFRQMTATVTIGSGRMSSIHLDPVHSALRKLDIPEVPVRLGVGMYVHLYDLPLIERLGRKEAVFAVGDPNHFDRFAAFSMVEQGTGRRTVGGIPDYINPRLLRVVGMVDSETDEYATAPTDTDEEAKARLRGQIWVIGEAAKRAERWCPQFESAVGILGVTPASITAQMRVEAGEVFPPGLTVNCHEQLSMPLGAILAYDGASVGGGWCWVRREANPRGSSAGTTNLMGPNGGHWSNEMRVVWNGTGDMFIIPPNETVMSAAPTGTRVSDRPNGSGSVYTKHRDGDWRLPGANAGVVTSAFFTQGVTTWGIIHFPPREEL